MKWSDYAVKNKIEPCIRDKNGCIVAWCAGYSDDELKGIFQLQERKRRSVCYSENGNFR